MDVAKTEDRETRERRVMKEFGFKEKTTKGE